MIPEGPLLVRYLLNAAAFLGYLGMVTWLSVLWRDRIDSACILITQWVEEVMAGKKTILGSISGLTGRGVEMKGNGVAHGSLEKEVMEMGVVKGSPV